MRRWCGVRASLTATCTAARSSLCSVAAAGPSEALGRPPRYPAQRDLPALPVAFPQLHRRLEKRELVGPGREAARAAEVVEASENADQCVRGGFVGDVVELVPAEMLERPPATVDLEPGGAKEERMQAGDRRVVFVALRVQPPQPLL